jgi:hypothetical protein
MKLARGKVARGENLVQGKAGEEMWEEEKGKE